MSIGCRAMPHQGHSHFTRLQCQTSFRAAGVLPVAVNDENEVVALLGGELTRTGPQGKVWRHMWSDFGGSREAVDADEISTAAREFSEETLGLFAGAAVDGASVAASAAAMEERLRGPDLQAWCRVSNELRRGSYTMFVVTTPFVPAVYFGLATQQNSATGRVSGGEKCGFAWVPLEGLLRTVATPAPRYMLPARDSVACGGLPPLPFFHLHPCFATSLRMAQQSGGLQRVVAGLQAVPLPPSPPSPPSAGRAAEAAAQHGFSSGSGARGMGYWLEVEFISKELKAAQDLGGRGAPEAGPSSTLEAQKARVMGQIESAARQQGQCSKKRRRRGKQQRQQQGAAAAAAAAARIA